MIEAAMSNAADRPPDESEVQRFRWRIVPAFVLFLWGGLIGIGGGVAFAAVLYRAMRNSWTGIAAVDPTVNHWVPVLLLSYAMMFVSGLLFVAAAYWCATARWRPTLIAALLGVAAYACFFLIFPGPVPL